jgi:histidine triad (HIT) family protein
MDCVFCKIRTTDSSFDPRGRAHDHVHGHQPLNSGHCLVATSAHAATIHEADVEDLKAVMATTKKVAAAIQHALKPDGLNLLQANGAAAFQSVPHFHMHLIPRWNGDGKGFDWKLVPGNRDHIMKNGERLRELLK